MLRLKIFSKLYDFDVNFSKKMVLFEKEKDKIMGNIIKLIILVAIGYGIYWVYENVDFTNLVNDTTNKIQNEKTIQRVTNGRQKTYDDARDVTDIKY